MQQTDLTSGPSGNDPDIIEVYIAQGGTTNIAVVAGDTVNVWVNPDDAQPISTITNGSNSNFSTPPIFISSNSDSTVQFTGPGY